MTNHAYRLEVRTLGDFSLMCGERPVLAPWPGRTVQMLFCTLLSPLDSTFSRERLCRCLWGRSSTSQTLGHLDETFDCLVRFLGKETGGNPFSLMNEGIALNPALVRVDAFDYYHYALEGLRQLSLGDAALSGRNFRSAVAVYNGVFLPGMHNRIIADARQELAALQQTITGLLQPKPPLARQIAPGGRMALRVPPAFV